MFNSLNTIKDLLNQYLKSVSASTEDLVSLGAVSDSAGGSSNGKIVLTIVNVQEEVCAKSHRRILQNGHNSALEIHAPLHLNVYVLLASNFAEGNYEESLKYLSLAMRFFHSHASFDHHSAPTLESHIERLTMELVNLDFNELSQLWNTAGAKYMPSALYKLRMVSLPAQEVANEYRTVQQPVVGITS